MLDTIRVRSPYIGKSLAEHVEGFLKTRMAIDNATQREEYRFVSGSLQGSWESSIAVNVKRQEWRALRSWGDLGAKAVTMLVECPPYLTVEGSVHKALLGHNVFGGPRDVAAATRWYLHTIASDAGCVFPDPAQWHYERVDWAWLFDLGDGASVSEYIQQLALARYPRRKVHRYADQTVMFSGTTTTWKVYWKGPEYEKHDRRRVLTVSGADQAEQLLQRAARSLRCELSVKAKKLEDLRENRQLPLVGEVSSEWLEELMAEETERIIHEGKEEMETVRQHQEVQKRLGEVYGTSLARRLFGTWIQMATMGEKNVKDHMNDATFYRQRKQLIAAGVSWLGADIHIRESAIPAGFTISRSSPFRLQEEAPEVIDALAPYRDAA